MVTNNQIEEIKNIIIDTVDPEKIILFGSYANGSPTEQSDVDLFLVMKENGKKKYEIVQDVRLALRDNFFVGKDILVDFIERYQRYRNIPYSFIGHIETTGKVLYER